MSFEPATSRLQIRHSTTQPLAHSGIVDNRTTFKRGLRVCATEPRRRRKLCTSGARKRCAAVFFCERIDTSSTSRRGAACRRINDLRRRLTAPQIRAGPGSVLADSSVAARMGLLGLADVIYIMRWCRRRATEVAQRVKTVRNYGADYGTVTV